MRKNKTKRKLNLKSAKRLLGYMFKNYPLRCALVVVLILMSALAQVGGIMLSGILIDDYIVPLIGTTNPMFNGLIKVILIMAVIYSAGILSTFLYNRIIVTVGQGVQKKIRDELFEKMQYLPVKYFDTHSHGDIMSRYTNDIDTLRQMLSQSLPQLLSSVVTILFVAVSMIITSAYMTLIVLVFFIIILVCIMKIGGGSAKYFKAQQAQTGAVNGYIEEMIHGQKVIKVFCHEEKSVEKFKEVNQKLCDSSRTAHYYANILMPAINNLGHLQYVMIAIVGGLLAVGGIGGVTLGAIAAFLQLSKSFTSPIGQVSQQLNSVITALAGAERIFELIDEQPEQDNGYVELVNAMIDEYGAIKECEERTGIWAWKQPHGDGAITYTRLNGKVNFMDVDFGYTENKPVLRNISMYANPGEKIAFVGSTGAGKTTITNLINRFYDIADGKIYYDDIDIKEIKKKDLRRSLGIVLQDTHLFSGTIIENIRYGKPNASDDEVVSAAKLANADTFISMLPSGYHTIIEGDGGALSQGQKQLIAIARAAIADPPVMILDEATSSIDTRTEAIVQAGMDSLMNDRTVFVIAHRLSTIQNSDVIIVMENGSIIERGTHNNLIEAGGKYHQLYTGKFKKNKA